MPAGDYEKLGVFYLGREVDPATGDTSPTPLLYDARDLTTHALCVGMTGSGKTGLCIALLEEAAIDGVPALVIDPKGDLGNLLLTFPNLAPGDFRPWVDPDAAARKGLTVDAFAEQQATLWRDGLERWDQDPGRIARLREAVDIDLYTPGSEAGIPISVLGSFDPPPAPPDAAREDADLLRERIGTTVSSLLGLLGLDADPVRSREHILLSLLFEQAWTQDRSLDLPQLIQQVTAPPVARVGVIDLDTFFPPRDRMSLAMALNNLLASPTFASWRTGAPLDLDRMLYTSEGKPRVAIVSIAHLSEAQRMFFVALLLNAAVGWVRSLPGTSSLRAIVYMDEVFGYLPPVANPPSKLPLLTLLKQARAFGVGVVLATQNPVDLDYKAISNIGTWIIGRLQTQRDRDRLLDGLTSAAAGNALNRTALEALIARLALRRFLLHNVHDTSGGGPVLFESRWAMSYLRGPLTRDQIATLMKDRPEPLAASRNAQTSDSPAKPQAPRRSADPVRIAGLEQRFVPAPPGETLHPHLVGRARVRYDAGPALRTLVLPLDLDLDWRQARETDLDLDALADEPPPDVTLAHLPPAAVQRDKLDRAARGLVDHLYRDRPLETLRCRSLGLIAGPGESERDFRVRLADAARQKRDHEVERLRLKYRGRLDRLDDRIATAAAAVSREESQAQQQKLDAALSVGTTVLGALFGRKKFSIGNVTRAGAAARRASRSAKEAQDVARAQARLDKLRADKFDLEREVEQEAERIRLETDPFGLRVDRAPLKARKSDIAPEPLVLLWAPRS